MDQVVIDFETRSLVPIDQGIMKYMHCPAAKALCMAYKINREPTRLWVPGNKQPFNPNEYVVYAFNISFDQLAWNVLTDWTELPLENCIDIQAICGRFTFFQKMDLAAKLLNKHHYKDATGKKLIQECCVPPFNDDPVMLKKLQKYCIKDVNAEYELLNNLPSGKLSKQEQRIWQVTQEINMNGIPVDVENARIIFDCIKHYAEVKSAELKDITEGKLYSFSQHVAIKNWVNELTGLNVSSVDKKHIDKILKKPNLPFEVKYVLKTKRELAKSSVYKVEKAITNEYMGRIYNALIYYIASTGRFSSWGFQVHNMPRDVLKEKEFNHVIDTLYKTKDIYFHEVGPINYAKMMLRGLIKASSPTSKIVWNDYSAIEPRVLFWLAGERLALKVFEKKDKDPKNIPGVYRDMAAFLVKKPVDQINKNDDIRYIGKQLILLCGYQGGAKKFYKTVNDMGIVEIPMDLAESGIKAYRKKYKKVKSLWYNLAEAAISAVRNFGKEYQERGCTFKCVHDRNKVKWLRLSIPSGRNLFYCEPSIGKSIFDSPEVKHMGINSYTKKWSQLSLSPGRITENIVQALSRDILCYHKLAIHKKYKIIFSVHDEIVCEESGTKAKECMDYMTEIMVNPPFWCSDLPLGVEGKISGRYGK